MKTTTRSRFSLPEQPSPNAQPNLNPIYTNAPVYVKSVENGELWTVGEADDLINIVHVWGWLPHGCRWITAHSALRISL